MEAVGHLAAEAGLEVPKPTPEAAEAERRRLDVVGVLEAVQAPYGVTCRIVQNCTLSRQGRERSIS
jgi:hypothetical protein